MKWYAVILPFLFGVSASQTPQRLGVDDAVRIGMLKSRTLQASVTRAAGAEAKATEAGAALLPALKFQAGYRRLSPVDPFAVKLPIFPTPIVISPTVLDNTSLSLGLQQPLFTGFRLKNAYHAASLQADASRSDTRSDRADMVLGIKIAYWTFYQSSQVLSLVKENVARLEADEQDALRLMNAGLATRNDVLRMQVQLSNARLAAIDAENDSQIAMMNLNNLLGQPLDTPLELTSTPKADTIDTGEITRVAWQDVNSRPDLQALSTRVEAARAGAAAARGSFWPQLWLSGNIYYNRPNARYQPTIDEFKNTWDVGIQLQFDVWNWGATAAAVDQADAVAKQQQLQLEQMTENATLEIKRSILGVQRGMKKVEVARVAAAQAEENLRVTTDKYQNGLATSADLLDAEVSLLQGRTNLTGASVELEIARAKLDKAVGSGE